MELLQKCVGKTLAHRVDFYKLSKGGRKTSYDHANLVKHEPHNRFIAYSLFNANLSADESESDPIYLLGVLQNVILAQVLYVGWTVLIYVDMSSYTQYKELYDRYLDLILQQPNSLVLLVDFRTALTDTEEAKVVEAFGKSAWNTCWNERGWDLALLLASQGTPMKIPLQYAKTCWRFFPAGEQVAFMSRDADARLNAREALAVEEWMMSSVPFHRIFDTMAHANPMLAGSWGAKPHCESEQGSDFKKYARCTVGSEALPGIIGTVVDFLANRDRLVSGYGIDEAFLKSVDDMFQSNLFANVMTFGAGGFYSGAVVFSMLKGKSQGLKLGQPMMTLLPFASPDNWKGDNQARDAFVVENDEIVMARDCYFFNEDLPVRAGIDPGLLKWIIHCTMHYQHCERGDLALPKLTATFKKFGVTKVSPTDLMLVLTKGTINMCQERFFFDPRVLPHFWYCLTRVVSEYLPFFETYGTFVSNDFELRLFQKAMRESFIAHPNLQAALLGLQNVEDFLSLQPKVVRILCTGKPVTLKYARVDLSPFFEMVSTYVRKNSRIMKHLRTAEREAYYEEMVYCVPVASMARMNLEF